MGKDKISNNSMMVKEVRDNLEEINKVGVSILLVEHIKGLIIVLT